MRSCCIGSDTSSRSRLLVGWMLRRRLRSWKISVRDERSVMRQLLLRMARVLAPVALVAALAASAGCASINPVAKAAQQPSHGSADGTGCTPSQRRAALAEDHRNPQSWDAHPRA